MCGCLIDQLLWLLHTHTHLRARTHARAHTHNTFVWHLFFFAFHSQQRRAAEPIQSTLPLWSPGPTYILTYIYTYVHVYTQ